MKPGTVSAGDQLISSGTGRMPPTPPSPGPRTTPVLADALALVLGIETQCLLFARDQYLKSDSKAARTK